MDKVPGAALAKAKQHPSIPVKVACLRASAEEVLKVADRDLGEPAKVVHFKRFPRTLRYHIRLGSFAFGHDSLALFNAQMARSASSLVEEFLVNPLDQDRTPVRVSHTHTDIVTYHQAGEIFPVDEHNALRALGRELLGTGCKIGGGNEYALLRARSDQRSDKVPQLTNAHSASVLLGLDVDLVEAELVFP